MTTPLSLTLNMAMYEEQPQASTPREENMNHDEARRTDEEQPQASTPREENMNHDEARRTDEEQPQASTPREENMNHDEAQRTDEEQPQASTPREENMNHDEARRTDEEQPQASTPREENMNHDEAQRTEPCTYSAATASACSKASPSITENTAREAFIRYADNKCCCSTVPAKEGVITGMEAFDTYRYRLVTFRETRSTQLSFVSYHGQDVDAPSRGAVPDIWDITVQPPNFFKEQEQSVRMPHTSYVQDCPSCSGSGKTQCTGCAGLGNVICVWCGGLGSRIWPNGVYGMCMTCGGRGRNICWGCGGRGFQTCLSCVGSGKIMRFTQLDVKRTNHINNKYVAELESGISEEKLQKVLGKMMHKDICQQVTYVKDFADPAVVEASKRLVREHQDAFISNGSRILQQCQTIELIPITCVSYTWKEKCFQYLVYGEENKVTSKDYPGSCCYGCCVLL
ncbi:protein SSUH2 homolog isoform X3 [Sardina pilchardus]|uniref:protein SSUH2 homolog isoform X2 n=2 Tax=Sardina pilchardus TaxID=27697 RepID=UPI002E1218E7